MCLGEHLRFHKTHIGVRNVLNSDKSFKVICAIGNHKGIQFDVLHEVPSVKEAHVSVNFWLLLNFSILDLRCHRGNELRLFKSKVL